jgi:cysteine/O-acetylserine efflux protein
MGIDLPALLAYVLVSTFTPGPSNISSASAGVLHGYRRTLAFQCGLAVGVFLMMGLSGWISTGLLAAFPALEPITRYAGAAYILYLAFSILRASYAFSEAEVGGLSFLKGLTLQLLNPKLVVYALTVFTGFLSPLTANPAGVAVAAVGLAAVSFIATSVWALFGAAIKATLRQPLWRLGVNALLALSLVYSALALVLEA